MAANLLDDPRYWLHNYNTQLSPQEETAFHHWMDTQSRHLGRNLYEDMLNYDMQGAWKAIQSGQIHRGHLPDTWKKPNHPTFSQEYANPMGGFFRGGQWQQDGHSWSFAADPLPPSMRDPGALQSYFSRVEPGSRLILPKGQ